MNISLHIEATSPSELQEAITGLAGITGAATPQTETDKPKRSNRKADKQPDPNPVETDQPDHGQESTDDTEKPESLPTVVELRAKAQEKGTTPEGKTAIKALLDEFGSKSISDVPEEKRIAFLQKLEGLK